MKRKLYKPIDVWENKDTNYTVRYRCFEIIGENKFCVQSADYYRKPVTEEHIRQLEKQFIELFIEVDPDERSESFDSLEKAISNYDEDFNQ